MLRQPQRSSSKWGQRKLKRGIEPDVQYVAPLSPVTWRIGCRRRRPYGIHCCTWLRRIMAVHVTVAALATVPHWVQSSPSLWSTVARSCDRIMAAVHVTVAALATVPHWVQASPSL